jgi:acetyl esterase/lipase
MMACAAPPSWDVTDRLPADYGRGIFTPVVVDIHYDPSDPHPDKVADIYLPASEPTRGVVVFAHGGAFVHGDKDDLFTYSGPLLRALDSGWAVVNINYRFDAFPAAVLDLDAAVRFVRSPEGRRIGLRPGPVVVAGHSAGATIAADLALAADSGPVTPFGQLEHVDGWISLAGPLDLDHPDGRGAWSRLLWRTGADPYASPVHLVSAGDPPGLVVQGSEDALVPLVHAISFARWAADVGHEGIELDIVRAAEPHCRGHVPSCGMSIRTLDAFLDRLRD